MYSITGKSPTVTWSLEIIKLMGRVKEGLTWRSGVRTTCHKEKGLMAKKANTVNRDAHLCVANVSLQC